MPGRRTQRRAWAAAHPAGGAAPRRGAGGYPAPHDEEMARQDGVELLQLVAESVASGVARHVLAVRLSHLPPNLSKPHHLRLARAALDPLAATADRARLFQLPGTDLVVAWRGDAEDALQESLRRIAHLFTDEFPADGPQPARAEPLALPRDAGRLCDLAAANLQRRAPPPKPVPTGRPLDLATLAALEARLARCDLSNFARRRAVCGPDGEGRLALRWERRRLSVGALAAALLPGVAVRADPWLFRRLTRTLDRRMLALLSAPGELRHAGPFGLDLNVATLLAAEFLRFDAALPARLRGQVTLNLSAADLLADPAAFVFARDFAHARGYRLLLRGVDAALLPALPLAPTGLDLMELRWSPELEAATPLADPARVLLSGADTRAAIDWGAARGVALFQGAAAVPGREPTRMSRNIALGGMAGAA